MTAAKNRTEPAPKEETARHEPGTRVLRIGAKVMVMIPTTHMYTGRVVGFDALSIVLEDSAWIAEAGSQQHRHHAAFADGNLSEVEPHPDLMEVPRMGTVVWPWPFKLPREAK